MFFAQFLLTALDLGRRLLQIAHDMNHRFAAIFQAQIRLVRILQEMHQRPSRIIQSLGLPSHAAAVLFIVSQDMDHGFALVGQLAVDHVQITQDMNERAAALLILMYAQLQGLLLLQQTPVVGLELYHVNGVLACRL